MTPAPARSLRGEGGLASSSGRDGSHGLPEEAARPAAPRANFLSGGTRLSPLVRGSHLRKGLGRDRVSLSGAPGFQVPGQVCSWPANLQPCGLGLESPTPQPGCCTPAWHLPTRSPGQHLALPHRPPPPPKPAWSSPNLGRRELSHQWGLLSRPSHQQHFLERLIRPSSLRR